MPKFVYRGDTGRYYPHLSLTPTPGRAYELAAAPRDGRWDPGPPAREGNSKRRKTEKVTDDELAPPAVTDEEPK